MTEFRLIKIWDAERELIPQDFQFILSPSAALEKAKIYYELDYLNYSKDLGPHDVPERKSSHSYSPHSFPYERKHAGMCDAVYDYTEQNLDSAWIIGIESRTCWDYSKNPFYFDEKSDLIYDCFMVHAHSWFEKQIRQTYEKVLINHPDRKPAPTRKRQFYGADIKNLTLWQLSTVKLPDVYWRQAEFITAMLKILKRRRKN